MPGFEGGLNIKWLRRLKFGDRPWMTRWETARYTQLLANGKARQFQLRMEANSVITAPSGMMEVRPGYRRITGLAWSGHGKIAKVEVEHRRRHDLEGGAAELPGAAESAVAVSIDGTGTASLPRSSVVRPTKGAMSSPIAKRSSVRWERTRCFTTTRSKPGPSTWQGR